MKNLRQLKFNCNKCHYGGELSHTFLQGKLGTGEKLSLINLNTLLHFFICSKCRTRDFTLSDSENQLLFDTSRNVLCDGCNLPIPFPRLNAQPGTRICIQCKGSSEDISKTTGTVFPQVPAGLRGKCPDCSKTSASGIVVVYQNSTDKSFFLGCSAFPKCRWSSSEYRKELN